MYFAQNLKYLRNKLNDKQCEIAELLGYRGKQGYGAVETGNSGISVDNLIKLADYFGVTLDQLVKQDLSKRGNDI